MAGIYHRPITRVAASHWVAENVPSDITFVFTSPGDNERYELGLPNEWVSPGQPYDQIAYTALGGGEAKQFFFQFPFSGKLAGIHLNHVATLQPGARRLQVTLTDMVDPLSALAKGTIKADFYADGEPRGETYGINFASVNINASHGYAITLEPDAGAPIILSGATVANEGEWDWPVPFDIPPYSMWGAVYLPGWESIPSVYYTDFYELLASSKCTLSPILARWGYVIDTEGNLFTSDLVYDPPDAFADIFAFYIYAPRILADWEKDFIETAYGLH